MMQATYFWELHHNAQLWRLNRPSTRRIFLKRQMRPRPLVVLEVRLENLPQGRFIEHNHVVQALPPD